MTKQELALEVIERLKKEYPDADCTLDYDNAWKLLVSVRLAAQCTDARVNVVVQDLYAKFPTVEALANADVADIESIVRPCGLGKSKARDISACMKILHEQYHDNVPGDFDALLKLPGVGRKSANLIMGDVFGKPAIVTDTHCIRLSNRIGLVDNMKEPKKVEMALWKGAELTAQVVFPVATNLKGQYKKIRPGVIALSQEFCFGKGFLGRVTAGNFTNNRMGAQAEMKYRTANGRLELGAMAGATVQSVLTDDEGWYISRKLRMNAALKASVYEPRFNLQFDLQAARYLYGDYGVRGDCTRHFGEYAIGVYGMYTDGEINGGFHFAIPLPGKKWSRNRGIRVRQADYFAMEYSMESWGRYADEKMGETYRTRPDENRSNRFFQPEYIRYFLIKEANK